jgi:hypothetical protein
MNDTNAARPNQANSPSSALLSVSDALSWIAFGEIRSDLDVLGLIERWGHSNAGPVLEALEARVAPAPFCLVQPLILDNEPWDGRSYAHKASSPAGPRMLRRIRARARQREGHLVTYSELAVRLREELEKAARDSTRMVLARQELLEALRASKLTAWGKPKTGRGLRNSGAPYERIPASIFIHDWVSVTEWGDVDGDPEDLTATFEYHGPRYSDIRFYTSDVMNVWPAKKHNPVEKEEPNPVEPPRSRGGRPPQHDWDEFWIEVVSYAAEKGLFREDRLELQQHMQEWTAQHWEQPPDPATIRVRLRRLFDTIEAARK